MESSKFPEEQLENTLHNIFALVSPCVNEKRSYFPLSYPQLMKILCK